MSQRLGDEKSGDGEHHAVHSHPSLRDTQDYDIVTKVSEASAKLEAELAARKKGKQVEQDDLTKELKTDVHTITWDEIESRFNTRIDHKDPENSHGLETAQAAELLKQNGPNRLTPAKTTPEWIKFLQHLTGLFSLLLWFGSILCFIAYGLDSSQQDYLYLGIVLAFVVFVTGVFSYSQDAKSAQLMAKFAKFLPEKTTVLRGGANYNVESEAIVVGDIVNIKAGDKVPADCRILKASNFKVDNSSLTGEPEPQKRVPENTIDNPLEAKNLAFYGTSCVEGSATAVIVFCGDSTVIGRISRLTETTQREATPINREIKAFIKKIGAIAIVLGIVFTVISFARGNDAIYNIVLAIGIIVANVPEGLLATVTVSLTLTAKRMASKKVLVKNLESVETLGSTTVIASDKTGTLTQNRMTAAHVWYDGKIRMAASSGHISQDTYDPTSQSFTMLRYIASLCNRAMFLQDADNMAKPISQRVVDGDASETAFLKFCEEIYPVAKLRTENKKLAEIPFSSATKFQASVHMRDNDPTKPRMLVLKGAPERVFDRSVNFLVNGDLIPKEDYQQQWQNSLETLMSAGERVLGLATRDLNPDDFPADFQYDTENPNFPLEGLTYVGLISLIDPPRSAVPQAVKNCQNAGIRVIMVTGDHPLTAEAISKQVNIINTKTRRDVARELGRDPSEIKPDQYEAEVLTGADLIDMTDIEIQKKLDYKQIIFARTSPQQKLIIVKNLQEKRTARGGNNIVAVTGDGVNDSPALKKADIGVAMGIAGSDVAKEAADMILLDDNFASIVRGVEEGRIIFDNLKKSIAYTLSSNIPEITPFLANAVFNIPLPLSTILILCVDLGTDMIPAISLAYETRESDIMRRPPRDSNRDSLVTVKLISFSYLQIGMIQALAGFYTYLVVLSDYGFEISGLGGIADEFDEVGSNSALNDPRFTLGTCRFDAPDVCFRPQEALLHAQTAFFVSIVVVQWADLLICKTRKLSILHQGMNNWMMNFGLFSETALAVILCYVPPLNEVLFTRPIRFQHWLTGMPFSLFIFFYDETRKFIMRRHPGGWIERNTYY